MLNYFQYSLLCKKTCWIDWKISLKAASTLQVTWLNRSSGLMSGTRLGDLSCPHLNVKLHSYLKISFNFLVVSSLFFLQNFSHQFSKLQFCHRLFQFFSSTFPLKFFMPTFQPRFFKFTSIFSISFSDYNFQNALLIQYFFTDYKIFKQFTDLKHLTPVL